MRRYRHQQRRGGGQRRRYLLLILIAILMVPGVLRSQNLEYMVKAGFLEKFARYCEWPEGSHGSTFNITVLGNSPFGGLLEEMYKDQKIKGRPIKISYVRSADHIPNCEILFICESEWKNIEIIIQKIKGQPILTIADKKGMIQKGVMINFYNTADQTIHFEINVSHLQRAGLQMDVVLLDYANLIRDDD